MSEVEQTAPVSEVPVASDAPSSEQADTSPSLESQETTEAPPPIDWRAALDAAPAEELRDHKKFWGIVGSELESRRTAWEAERQAQDQRAAQEKFEQELLELSERDPDAFAERFRMDHKALKGQINTARAEAEQTRYIGSLIGQAVRQIPEWSQLAPKDHESFFKAVAEAEQKAATSGGDPRAAALSAFNTAVADRIGELRADAKYAARYEADRAKDRAATRQEVQAESLLNGDRPDASRVRGNGAVSDEPNWRTQPAEWAKWSNAQDAAASRARLIRSR